MIDRLPGSLLQLEGLAVAAGALVLYVDGDHGWLVGYGLKYPTRFEDTHLQRV